jgi:8-oxo-dGTP pyrophosphatase MutT (NUDIX family)
MWNLPGGRVETHEAPWEAVVREVEEETGLHVQVEKLIGVYAVQQKQDLAFNCLCQVTGGALRHSPESDQLGWFRSGEIPANTLPRHVERIKRPYSDLQSVHLHIQLLIDATYTSVNHPHLSSRERNALILQDLPSLIEELRKYIAADTGVVLVKANVCELLGAPAPRRRCRQDGALRGLRCRGR